MLEQPDVPGHERRCREAEDLPEWKIPWHDRQNRPERLIVHIAAGGVGCDWLVGKELRGMLDIISTCQCAFGGLLNRRSEWLAHLSGHDPAKDFALRFQYLGGAGHQPGTLGDGCAPVDAKR